MLGDTSKITIRLDAEPHTIAADHAVTVGLIVNELATNTVKYAFPTGAGEIVLGFGCDPSGCILAVSDNGVGMRNSAEGTTLTGLGSRFVKVFVHQVG